MRRVVTSFRLSTFYLLYFLAVGVTLPFLPAYFTTLGISSSEIGVLLSIAPVFSLLMPPVWGQLADRSGHPGVILLVLCVGALLGYTVLLGASGFSTALVAMALYSVFGSSVTSIIDSMSLQHLTHHRGEYAHLRRWGSLGFVGEPIFISLSSCALVASSRPSRFPSSCRLLPDSRSDTRATSSMSAAWLTRRWSTTGGSRTDFWLSGSGVNRST